MLDNLVDTVEFLARSAPEEERGPWRRVVRNLRLIVRSRRGSALSESEKHREDTVSAKRASQLLRTTREEVLAVLDEAGDAIPRFVDAGIGERRIVRFRMGALLDYLAKARADAALSARGLVSAPDLERALESSIQGGAPRARAGKKGRRG